MAEKISLNRVDEMLRATFAALKAMGGSGRGAEVLALIAPKLNLTPHELGTTATGATRWDTHVRFYTSDCVKAGYLSKSEGMWTLTEAGEKALSLPPGQLIRSANRIYRGSRKTADASADALVQVADEPSEQQVQRQAAYDQAKEAARVEIDLHLDALGPYDFQRLVAELLKAMGYHVPFVAVPGPDGGIDVVAYSDPLGTSGSHVRVQVKHRDQKVTASEVRELLGLLRRPGDIGLIVSSGGFTSEADREIRSSGKHIEAVNQDRLIRLWQEHYDRLSQGGKRLLPLIPIYFLAPEEES